ncbi:hypothetical protein V8B97DRAFT_1918604 [Scleroderma yunnanense]
MDTSSLIPAFSDPFTLSSTSSDATPTSGPSSTPATTVTTNGAWSSTDRSATIASSTSQSSADVGTPTASTGTPLPTPSVSSMTSSADQLTSASFDTVSSSYGTSVTWTFHTFTTTSSALSTSFLSSATTVVSISSTTFDSPTSSSPDASSLLPTTTTVSPWPSDPSDTPTSTQSTTTLSTSSLHLDTVSSSQKTTTTLLVPETVFTMVSPSWTQCTSTYTMVSVLPGGGGTTTLTITASGVLSTASGNSSIDSASPGKVAAVIVGIMVAIVCAALWIFCARKRQRKLEQDAALLGSTRHLGPLEGEVFDGDELEYVGSSFGSGGPPVMEERYAGILAALHTGPPAGASTEGVYGSRQERTTNEGGYTEDDIIRASSPTLPLDALAFSDDRPYIQPLSPPPPAVTASSRLQTSIPPSAYVDPVTATRRRSLPGPDAAAWLGGHSIAPSCASHYAHSQTMGSGSGSCSVDMLTRTHTGSDEPLLGISRPSEVATLAPAHTQPQGQTQGGNRLGLGSAFGSAEGSMYSPSYSYDAKSGSMTGSGSYGRSGTPSSFDVLRSVSSQGALSSSYSHGHNFGLRFGFGGAGSGSSASTGRKRNTPGFGNPQSSFRWKERASALRIRDGHGDTKEDWRRSAASSVSVSGSGSVDEKRGRSSPVNNVRALLNRLRGGHTPSPMSSSRGLPATPTRTSRDIDIEKAVGGSGDEEKVMVPTQPPGSVTVAPRSYVLSNPDPRPPSLYSSTRDPLPSVLLGEGGFVPSDVTLYDPLDPMLPPVVPYAGRASVPSPAPTEASRLPEGLLHPRLQIDGRSVTSFRDFEDYSRPIGGLVNNRMHSTTTFGTLDNSEPTPVLEAHSGLPEEVEDADEDATDVFGTPIDRPTDSWLANGGPHLSTRPSR